MSSSGLRRQSGQAIAFAAVGIVALVGALAFVVDAGFFLEGRRELQNAADSAALAGVVFLPDCPAASASCPAPNNAQDMASAYVNANGPIVRQLCGHGIDTGAGIDTAVVPPSGALQAGTYTNSPTQPGLYYTFTVTLSCTPGFSFGRILGLFHQSISASATAIVGALGQTTCTVPLDAVSYSFGTSANNWGYTPGLGNIPGVPGQTSYSLGGASPDFDLINNLTNYVPDSGGFLELCLTGSNCGGSDLQNWFAGAQCIVIDAGEDLHLVTSPGSDVGPVTSGLETRGFNPAAGQSVDCPQSLSSIVDTSTWKVINNSTPCLVDVAILDQSELLATGRTNARVLGFVTVFIQHFNGSGSSGCPSDALSGSNKCFQAVVVERVRAGKVLPFRPNATYATRLIR